MSDTLVAYLLGVVTAPVYFVLWLGVLWLFETGRQLRCEGHGWTSGTTSTPRIVRLARYWLHRLRHPKYHSTRNPR